MVVPEKSSWTSRGVRPANRTPKSARGRDCASRISKSFEMLRTCVIIERTILRFCGASLLKTETASPRASSRVSAAESVRRRRCAMHRAALRKTFLSKNGNASDRCLSDAKNSCWKHAVMERYRLRVSCLRDTNGGCIPRRMRYCIEKLHRCQCAPWYASSFRT